VFGTTFKDLRIGKPFVMVFFCHSYYFKILTFINL